MFRNVSTNQINLTKDFFSHTAHGVIIQKFSSMKILREISCSQSTRISKTAIYTFLKALKFGFGNFKQYLISRKISISGKFVKFQHCKLKTFVNNQLTTVVPSSFLLGLFMLNKFLSSFRRFRCNFNISSTLILALARPTSTFEAKIGPKMVQKTRKTYTSLIFLLSEIHIFTRFL